jgi:hypothetical protein
VKFGMEDEKITIDNKSLLSLDLSGRTIIITCSESFFTEHSNPILFKKDKNRNAWHKNDDERLTIAFILLRKISGGMITTNEYEAIVLNNDAKAIEHWDIVKIDEKEKESLIYSNEIALTIFGISSIGIKNPELLESNEIDIKILDELSYKHQLYFRKMFDQMPESSIYNALKADEKEKEKVIAEIERLQELADHLKELREVREKAYTEITYWKEYDTYETIRKLREQIYGDLVGFEHLSTAWENGFKTNIKLKKIVIEEDTEKYFFHRKEIAKDKIPANCFVIRIIKTNDTYILTGLAFHNEVKLEYGEQLVEEEIEHSNFRENNAYFPKHGEIDYIN